MLSRHACSRAPFARAPFLFNVLQHSLLPLLRLRNAYDDVLHRTEAVQATQSMQVPGAKHGMHGTAALQSCPHICIVQEESAYVAG